MQVKTLKRTKIVATIGPATDTPDKLDALLKAGANAFRLNMSHGTHEQHAAVVQRGRRMSKLQRKPVAIIADLQGPKIRVGILPEDGVALVVGQEVQFAYDVEYKPGLVPIQYDFSTHVKPGQPMFLRDGMMEVAIESVKKGVIHTKVVRPGVLFTKQGINLPDTSLGGQILTDKDIADLEFAASHDADYVALSFVQSASDIEGLRERLAKLGSDMKIIAKVETKLAVDNLEDIVKASDAVMVARGDLAIETQPEQVPVLQQRIIDLCQRHQRIVIVATQMLESMITSAQPTRAEVSDVATAVMQGADAVMLSGESAMGKYPIETVALMRKVIVYTEQNRVGRVEPPEEGANTRRNAIAAAAITLAERLDAKVILAETTSGQTARNLSSRRPRPLIVVATSEPRVYQQLAILWGTRGYIMKSAEGAGTEVMRILQEEHNVAAGDIVVKAAGRRVGVSGSTDTIQLLRVAENLVQ